MNILLDRNLPEFVTVEGERYPVRADFRTWMRYEGLLEKFKSQPEKALSEIILLCYEPPRLPKKLDAALGALSDFYRGCTGEDKKGGEKAKRSCGERIYSFEEDAGYIYAAFIQQYGIDLRKSDMHWWEFRALFGALCSDTKMREIMGIRACDTDGISDRKMRERYRRLKSIYALEDMRSEEERERDMGDMLW